MQGKPVALSRGVTNIKFEWTDECEASFQELKKRLVTTQCYWTVCTLFNEHSWGLDHVNYAVAEDDEVELHSTGRPTWTWPTHEVRSDTNRLA